MSARGAPARAGRALACAALACAALARPLAAQPGSGGPGPLRLAGEPALEIGLGVDLDTVRIDYDGDQDVTWPRGPDAGTHPARGPLEVRVSGAQAVVWPRDHARAVPLTVLAAGDTLWVGNEGAVAGDRALFGWNGGHWRGRLKLFLNARGRLTLVTRVRLEAYLLGVVPGELGGLSDSLLEAGKAQAVAARSYTLFYRGRRGSEGFDLHRTVEDQVYGSAESERPLATQCVQATRGLLALWDGAPIRANYCSTCGGISAEAWEAWPTGAYPYLQSRLDRGAAGPDYCAASPQYRWRERWTPAEFCADLARYGPANGVALPAGGVGGLEDVQVAARSRSGRVWRLLVRTTTGAIAVPAYTIRPVLRRSGNGGGILRSDLFKIAVLRDPAGRAREVVASGGGSGHGVGLCQTGALAMARGGATAAEILAHYYPGTALERAY